MPVPEPSSGPASAGGADLNLLHAEQLVRICDDGAARRGPSQGRLDLVADGAVAVRDGVIVAVGTTEQVLAEWGEPSVPTIDATGRTVLPGLVECHSHPVFAGERHAEYAERLGGLSLEEVAARGGGIWSSVVATRDAGDDELEQRLARTYGRILHGGVTTLEVKSGYGLTTASELRQLELLDRSRASTPMELVVSFLGAHVVPRDLDRGAGEPGDRYTELVAEEMLPAVVEQGIAAFHDLTVEDGLFTPAQAMRLMERSRAVGLPVRVHADAWKPSEGWRTAVAGGAVSAEHLTYTPEDEIREVGATDTVAVLLPVAELVYLTDRRAGARTFVEQEVPVAIATDHCSSIHATSLLSTVALSAPWFLLTPGEALVAATLNAAYSLGLQADRGSLDVGKRGDLLVLDVAHPEELFLSLADAALEQVVIAGEPVVDVRSPAPAMHPETRRRGIRPVRAR